MAQKEMLGLKIVGQMLVRNEADVIRETVTEVMRWVDTLVVLDGASNDGTLWTLMDLAAEYDELHDKTIYVESRPDPKDEFHDHIRNELLELTAPFKPDWVLSVDGDEIWHYDPAWCPSPITAIVQADAVGANVVRSYVPQFWLTFEDIRRGALNEDTSTSIQARRRWYSWGHMMTAIWKWDDRHYYPKEIPKRTPEIPKLTWREWQKPGPIVPMCKHYCIRTVEQGVKRARERQARGAHQYFGKYRQTWIIDEKLARLHYLDPEDERWCTEVNHDLVHQYMAGEL